MLPCREPLDERPNRPGQNSPIQATAAQIALPLRVANVRYTTKAKKQKRLYHRGAEPGDAAHLIRQAGDVGLIVKGLSFHVGSQCSNFEIIRKRLPSRQRYLRMPGKRGIL